ncbi:MAG: ubiquinol-cytochrome c reductase iron-sulfur subunit [Candidatus Marinimicrobia bacterium]|nr:ubiquinol-cytochrome c reductase iron-sulfur subunit [Candidatus Neomarinimicrobiota bacterium]MCF7828491.1 ubiquinol-cytochrome c reductase iron-sulfur subunit [Candidatus Neomarinimicrobiota bacterium]MCF7881981.1 ubiquinol-cytochrome c reductase iron-sulfur subunit [Candidatus Neomarinimicrobiota bacterium]
MSQDFKRRTIVNWLLGGGVIAWLSAIFFPVLKYLQPPSIPEAVVSSVKAATVNELANNSSKIFKFGNKPGLLIKTPAGEWRAFTAICTHLDCIVQYRDDLEHIWCACHNGHYDLQGRNISGPPPRPLEEYDVNIQGKDVYVSKRT